MCRLQYFIRNFISVTKKGYRVLLQLLWEKEVYASNVSRLRFAYNNLGLQGIQKMSKGSHLITRINTTLQSYTFSGHPESNNQKQCE